MSSSSPQVPRETVSSAVSALAKFLRKREAAKERRALLSDERDEVLLLLLSLRRFPSSPSSLRPRLLPLPHPFLTSPSISVCLLSDDRPNSPSPPASALLDAAKSLGLPVSEAIPISSLRSDYRPFESRRRLAGSHDIFVADRAILPFLPNVLGKAFYSTKKVPIPVDFSRVGWPEQLRRILSSAFLFFRSGTVSAVKVGTLDMEEGEIVENVVAAVGAAVGMVPKNWANVRSLHLRASQSPALPIYQAVPESVMRIDAPEKPLEVDGAGEGEAGGKRGGKRKKKALRYVDGIGEEEVGRKRKKKRGDAMDVEVGAGGETEKKRRKKKCAHDEDDAAEDVGKKKGRKKSERALEVGSDNKEEKRKRKKGEGVGIEVCADEVDEGNELVEKSRKKKKKGKGDDVEVRMDEVDQGDGLGVEDRNTKKKKKKGKGVREDEVDEGIELGLEEEKSEKKKKKRASKNAKREEAEAVGANSVASDEEIAPAREKEKSSKAKKLEGDKAKKMRSKRRV